MRIQSVIRAIQNRSVQQTIAGRGRHLATRRWGRPTIFELMSGPRALFTEDADDLVAFWTLGDDLNNCRTEFEELSSALSDRRTSDQYPGVFDVQQGTAWAIFAHTRTVKPDQVLETGVANGISSYYILNAMRLNGHGTLHSVDVSAEVGSVLSDEEKIGWDLMVLNAARQDRQLERYIAGLPTLDLFIHDSLHTFAWMALEYRLALTRLRPGSWIASDDVDWSYAYQDLCAEHKLHAMYLLDRHKVFGTARLPTAQVR